MIKNKKFSFLVGVAVFLAQLGVTRAEDCTKLRDEGFRLFEKGEYVSAIDAFQRCIETEPKAGAMAQMASALNAVGRYDEALRWYEKVLVDFPKASADLKKKVRGEIDTLVSKVGTITVEGDVIAGARLFIDAREVGALPLSAPVRVAAGVHSVRAEKPGFAPIVSSVSVTAGQSSVAKLVATERYAKLDVREKHNWIVHVEIDGNDMGETPWSDLVPVGKHRVRLRGFISPDALEMCETPDRPVHAGTLMESEEKGVDLYLYETQSIELSAEDRDTSLRIESIPPLAVLRIDGKDAGKTAWEGRLSLGEHVIELLAPGFVPEKQTLTLLRRKHKDLRIRLDRLPEPLGRWSGRNVGMALGFGIGALGLGTFAISGGYALQASLELKAVCRNGICPGALTDDLDRARASSGAAVAGLVLGGVGMAAGTLALFSAEYPKKPKPTMPSNMRVEAGAGSLGVQVTF